MDKVFRFVLIGTGNIASTYVTACSKLPDVEIVGAVSRSGRRPKGIPESAPFETAPSLKEIKSPFDAVIITTPNGLHHEGAIEAASLGKHVLTEKPLDITAGAMDKMIKTCRDAKVRLAVTYQRRMRPDNIAMKKILEEKKLGKVFAADLKAVFFRDAKYYSSAPYRGKKEIDGGGPFIQQASHNIDIYAWFFGRPSKVVSMLGTFMHDIDSEDHGSALLKHPDGMIGNITASTSAWPGFPPVLTIYSEAGTVIMENDIISAWHVKGIDNPGTVVKTAGAHSGASSAAVSDTSGHEAVISDFISAVKENRDPAVTGESARLATEIILEIYNSNLLGN